MFTKEGQKMLTNAGFMLFFMLNNSPYLLSSFLHIIGLELASKSIKSW